MVNWVFELKDSIKSIHHIHLFSDGYTVSSALGAVYSGLRGHAGLTPYPITGISCPD